MANEVIGIDVQVKLEQLRAQLATLGPGMDKEAKAMTAALAKEVKKQTAAVKKQAADMAATNGVKKLGDQAADAGVKFDKLGMAMGPIGGVISKISPEAGSLASVVAGLTSGFQGLAAAGGGSMSALAPFAAILAPIAIGIGVVAGVMADMEREAEESAAAMEGLVSAMEAVGNMTAGAADAMTDFKVKIGQMTSIEAAYQKAIKQVATEYTTANAAIEESIRLRIASGKEEGLSDDVSALREQAKALKASSEERARAIAGEMEWAEEVRKSNEFIAERDKAAADGAKAAAAAAKDAADTAAMYARDEAARNETAFDERVAEARKSVRAVQKRLDEEKAAKEKAAQDDIDRAERTAEAEIEARSAVKSASLSIMGSATDALMLLSDNLGESNKKAALDAFNAAKALAIATAVVNAALGVTNALATGGAAAPVLAVAAGVSGAVSVATIAATEPPAFAAGGFIDGAPTTGVPITAHPNEAILNQQGRASIGDDAIRAANAGRGGEGGMTVSMIYKHKVFDYFVRDNLRTGGPLASAVRRGDRVGQLRRGRG